MPPKPKLPPCGFYVSVNENDYSVPIRIKKVAKGKRVSILSKITGSRIAAVNTLKQLLGVGGEVSEDQPDSIELQGDQSGRIATTLRNLDALRGEPTQTGPTVVVPPKQGFEKFMKQKAKTGITEPPFPSSEEMSEACILVHGRYWPYCNGNCSFCPPLTDVFEGVDVYCSWFNPEDTQGSRSTRESKSEYSGEMTSAELAVALSELGMRAEVGEACRTYEKEKRMKPWLLTSEMKPPSPEHVRPPARTERIAVPPAAPVRRKEFVDRPVRVILNNSKQDEEDSEYFVMEISLLDVAQWMSEYEYFVVSVLSSETSVVVANHEMVDSRTLKLLFYDKASMDNCQSILNDVMPSFFQIRTRDAISVLEAPPAALEEETVVLDLCAPNFEEMAIDLGLDSNEEFWKQFSEFIDKSDGTQAGYLHAFQSAVLSVTC